MLQRLINSTSLPANSNELAGRIVLALGVASLTLAVSGTLL